MQDRVLVTGGAGYIGSVLVRKLVDAGKKVRVLDNLWYGKEGIKGLDVELIKGDIRNSRICDNATKNIKAVVHLAGIAEDRGCELDEGATYGINVIGTRNLIDFAKLNGAERFLYASSSSVYGVNIETRVTEEIPVAPINAYGKSKVESEKIVLDARTERFFPTCIRCATVAGFSPRMRGDLLVNLLTLSALDKGRMTLYGGKQTRPNVHIDVITDLYLKLLNEDPELIAGEVFNAGFENLKVSEIAQMVRAYLPSSEIIVNEQINDPRSYALCSDKLVGILGFMPKKGVDDAIFDIIDAYIRKTPPFDSIKDSQDSRLWNIKWIKKNKLI